jgi:hypothetical protein
VQPIVNAEGIAGRIGDGSYDATIERESLLRTLAEGFLTQPKSISGEATPACSKAR